MKKITICFDGTCNEPEDVVQKRKHLGFSELEDNSITNILKLHFMLGGNLENQNSKFSGQYCYYYSGVGTYGNKIQRAFNAAVSPQRLDADRIMQHALDDLADCYQPGDEVFLFGFSRGAAMARQFAVKLEMALPEKNPKVRFLGVFDTVASMGVKGVNLEKEEKPTSDVLFENQTIAKIVQEGLHLVALDEKRKAFQPTLMNKEERVTEIWFSGSHSDIGGGYRLDSLSDITLQFMLDQFRDRQLGLQILHPVEIKYEELLPSYEEFKIDYSDVMLNPDPFSTTHQQKRLLVASLITLSDRLLRVNQNDQQCAWS